MFNYLSGASQTNNKTGAGSITNIEVPQKEIGQPDAVTDSNQMPLKASLLNLQDMQMNDIDQIAENADNLIEILQTIKQAKLNKDQYNS